MKSGKWSSSPGLNHFTVCQDAVLLTKGFIEWMTYLEVKLMERSVSEGSSHLVGLDNVMHSGNEESLFML